MSPKKETDVCICAPTPRVRKPQSEGDKLTRNEDQPFRTRTVNLTPSMDLTPIPVFLRLDATSGL